jgi:hypothetical protein
MYAVKRGLGDFWGWLAGVYAHPADPSGILSAPAPGTVISPAGPGYGAVIQGTSGPYRESVGHAPVPTAEQLAGDPGETVQELVDAQANAQRALDAGLVESSASDEILGAAGAGVTAVENAVPWLALGVAGAAAVVLYAMSRGGR